MNRDEMPVMAGSGSTAFALLPVRDAPSMSTASWVGPPLRSPRVVTPEDSTTSQGGTVQMRRLAPRRSDRAADAARLQLEKMAAIARVTSGLAHDINNVLTAILGNTELLRDMVEDEIPAERAKRWMNCLDGIDDVSRRAASLTERLLNMTRPCRDDPIELDLAEWVVASRERWEDELAPGCYLGITPPETPTHLRIQERVLAEILDSVVTNAAESMPEGGPIRIEMSSHTSDDGERFGVVEVTDGGPGITDEIRDLIFEPFFTTKAVGAGIGFGLATVYARLSQIGGSIELFTAPDRGTTCRIRLPVDASLPER